MKAGIVERRAASVNIRLAKITRSIRSARAARRSTEALCQNYIDNWMIELYNLGYGNNS